MVEQPRSSFQEYSAATEGRDGLGRFSIEIIPSPGIGERVVNAFGGSKLKVSVTSSPNLNIESTLAVCQVLAGSGFDVVPHIGAFEIRDRGHLVDVAGQIEALEINEVFLIKGDGEQKGKYRTSAQLMRDLAETGIRLGAIGIAGHPEGINGATSEQLLAGIQTREALARAMGAQFYIITQMCFDAGKIMQYADDLRSNKIGASLVVGLPIPEKINKLYETAEECRVGDSKGMLLARPQESTYSSEKLVEGIEAASSDGLISGYHIYTFNKIKRLTAWLGEISKSDSVRRAFKS